MKNITRFAVAAILLRAVAGPAMAQQAMGQTPTQSVQLADAGPDYLLKRQHHGHHDDHGRGHGVNLIDSNGDGLIGADEAAAAAEDNFARLDANGDGSLTEAQFSSLSSGHQHWWSSLLGGNTSTAAASEDSLKASKEKFAALDTEQAPRIWAVV